MSTPPGYISGTRSGGFTYTSGQSVDVVSGGVAYNMTIDKGATESLYGGGSATNTIVNLGGEVDVGGYLSAPGYTTGTQLSGGLQSVTNGVAYNTKVYKGGVEDVSSSGTDSGSQVSSGGGEHVYSGGIGYNAKVAKGGTEFLTQGGTASGATIGAGGRVILAGDVLYDSNFVATSGTEKAVGVYKAGVETITLTNFKKTPYNKIVSTATASGYVRDYFENATPVAEEQRIGNEVYYTSAGTTYSAASTRYADAGSGTDITIAKGGHVILAGGTATNLTLASGSTEIIGGQSVVHSAGGTYKFHFSGITVSDSTIGKGVKQIVNAGNTALSATITAGGTQIVKNGATAQDSIIDGGKMTLGTTAKLTGSATFAGTGGELVISSTTMPTETISGFGAGDKIQLAGVKYAAGATATVKTAGIVTITDAGTSYALHIAGAAVGQKFNFGTGSILTTPVAASQMRFLAPPAPASASPYLETSPPSPAAAPAQTGWDRNMPVQGTVHTLLTSAAQATSPIPLSGGTSY